MYRELLNQWFQEPGTNSGQINNSKDLTCTYLNTSSPGGASVRIEEHCSQVQDDLFHSVCALDIIYNTKEMFILNNFKNNYFSYIMPKKWSFCHKLWFSSPMISMQPNVVDLRYFKLWILLGQIFKPRLKFFKFDLRFHSLVGKKQG